MDGTTGKVRLPLRDGPRAQEAHERSDHVADGHAAEEAVVRKAPPLLVAKDVLDDEGRSAEGEEASALGRDGHGPRDGGEARHGCGR